MQQASNAHEWIHRKCGGDSLLEFSTQRFPYRRTSNTVPIQCEIARAYTTLGEPASVHPVSAPSDPASDPDHLKSKT